MDQKDRAALWDACAARCAEEGACAAFSVAPRKQQKVGEAVGGQCTWYTPLPTVSSSSPAGGGQEQIVDQMLSAARHEKRLLDQSTATGSSLTSQIECFVRLEVEVDALARHEFVLTANSLQSPEVMLNGAPLQSEAHQLGELPQTSPLVVQAGPVDGNDPPALQVSPLSVSFMVFPNAKLPACL